MRESFPGVMSMAVNTFLKITINCKQQFLYKYINGRETTPFIHEIIRNQQDNLEFLEEKDILVYFEALGNII